MSLQSVPVGEVRALGLAADPGKAVTVVAAAAAAVGS
jgi:hypothetical protein